MAEVPVTIIFKGKRESYSLRKGLGLQALHTKYPTPLEFDCREADCGICICRIAEGAENLSPMTEREKDFLQAMHAAPDERLACQTRVMGPCTILVDDFS